MARPAAQVKSGARGPQDIEIPGAAAVPLAAELQVAKATALPSEEVEVIFQGKPGYIVTITAPQPVRDADGTTYDRRPFVVKFGADGLLRLRKDATDADGNPVFQKAYDKLTRLKQFGFGRDYWLLSEAKQTAAAAMEEALVAQVSADEALLERVAARLGKRVVSSFEQKAAEAESKGSTAGSEAAPSTAKE